MAMVFCHACGKEIHDSAQSCPQCGAIQNLVPKSRGSIYHWTSVTSFILGIIVLFAAMTEPEGKWSSEAVFGGIIFAIIPIVFGIISLSRSVSGRWMAISGISLGVLVLFVSLGSI